MSASVATFECPHIGNSNTVQQVMPDVLLGLSAVGGLFSKEGCEVSIKELDTLLSLLAEKKRKMEQVEAERNMQILLEFLHSLRKQKVNELNEVQSDHFKHFFAPELGKYGYQALFKRKTAEVFSGNMNTIFFR